MSQFIRIKRQDHTYFMHVEPTDSFLSVKAKVAELNDRQNAGDVRIFNTDRSDYFEDEATIGDQQVPNDAVLFAVLKKGEGPEDFEAIEVQASMEPTKSGEA